jgi:mycofactocin system glycosyltransferase
VTETMPAGIRLALDPSVRRYRGGHVLVGGRPLRAMRLSPAGLAALEALRAPGRDASPAARQLARRLTDAGLAHPRPARTSEHRGAQRPHDRPIGMGRSDECVSDVTVVVPVRDRPHELDRCLAALQPGPSVIVVDDGSDQPGAIKAICHRYAARVIRRPRPGGPAAARNAALAHATTELIAFLDSDCVPRPGWLERLVPHFDDPLVAAAAPRVRALARDRDGLRERFLAARSPLDMGPREARVAPGAAVAYVPSAALVARRCALGGGFEAGLRHGEDVDLVWRLHDAGWRVRYDPAARVDHAEPTSWRATLARRRAYGTAAAPLAARHPGRLVHLVLSPSPAAAATALVCGRRGAAMAIIAAQAALLARRLRDLGVPARRCVGMSAAGVGQTLVGASRAATALAAPALLLAAGTRRGRVAAAGLAIAGPLEEWARCRPRVDPARWALACLVDDIAYGAGVWRGCLAQRTLAPMLPRRP